ncbi:MAG: sulfotransferase domain-containing protein [Gammaproteobacteria bacterium]|nr:sulfotransferase domain-containing protein [Gammaproteobacteria bacterium]
MSKLSNSQNNLLQGDDLSMFSDLDVKYTISSRSWLNKMTIEDYVKKFFPYIKLDQVESLFGFSDQVSMLYGGRSITPQSLLSKGNVAEIYNSKLGLSLTLTNHFFDEESYQNSYDLLSEHHKEGNSVVCENDELAKRIKQDFPLYKTKASLIKNLNSYKKVVAALDIYDHVVIPMDLNDDDDFLQSLPSKDRIIVFGNGNCAYNCHARICYKHISKKITGLKGLKHSCSKQISPREKLGHIFFDLKKLKDFGFTHFKLVPSPVTLKAEKKAQKNERIFLDVIKTYKESVYIYSFPKSGRTWFRYILANYLNLYFDLGINIDLHTMFTLIPNDGAGALKGIGAYKYVQDSRFPAIIASHKTLNLSKTNTNKVILLRQVYDVMVSDYFQHVHLLNKFKGTISEFIRSKNSSLYGYCKFINSINSIENKGNNLFISYESMHENITDVIEQSLTYLDIPIDRNIINESVALSTFDKMKKSEQENGLAGRAPQQYCSNGARIRQGKVNNYRHYLSKTDIEYIEFFCTKNLTDSSKILLGKMNIDYVLEGKLQHNDNR